jgi:hypothetical protein
MSRIITSVYKKPQAITTNFLRNTNKIIINKKNPNPEISFRGKLISEYNSNLTNWSEKVHKFHLFFVSVSPTDDSIIWIGCSLYEADVKSSELYFVTITGNNYVLHKIEHEGTPGKTCKENSYLKMSMKRAGSPLLKRIGDKMDEEETRPSVDQSLLPLSTSDQTLANDLTHRLRNVVTEKKGKFWANHPVNVDESQTELAIIKHLRKILVNGPNDKMKISFKTTQKNFGSRK